MVKITPHIDGKNDLIKDVEVYAVRRVYNPTTASTQEAEAGES
jgi:hypothetical protein